MMTSLFSLRAQLSRFVCPCLFYISCFVEITLRLGLVLGVLPPLLSSSSGSFSRCRFRFVYRLSVVGPPCRVYQMHCWKFTTPQSGRDNVAVNSIQCKPLRRLPWIPSNPSKSAPLVFGGLLSNN